MSSFKVILSFVGLKQFGIHIGMSGFSGNRAIVFVPDVLVSSRVDSSQYSLSTLEISRTTGMASKIVEEV